MWVRRVWVNSLLALAMALGASARGCGGDSRRTQAQGASGAAGKASGAAGTSSVIDVLGTVCVEGDENRPSFNGFNATETNIEQGSPACGGAVCAMNHFQGRVTCPYGQTEDELQDGGARCFVPGTSTPVTVPVQPQLLDRRASTAAVCTCRCAGPGSGPFCPCTNGTQCTPFVKAIGLGSDDNVSGSYCLLPGTEYDAGAPDPNAPTCSRIAHNCGSEDGT